jgi:hypothetical protein
MDEIVDYLDESHEQSLMMVTKGPPLLLKLPDLVDMATECFKALDLLSVLSLDNLP